MLSAALALALLLPALAGGLALTFALPLRLPALPRLGAAFCAGTTLLGLAALLLGCAFGDLTGPVVALALTASAAPTALLAHPVPRGHAAEALREARAALAAWRGAPGRAALAGASALLLGVVLWRVFAMACFVTPEGLFTADGHNLGDLPFHLAVIQGFAGGANFPPQHPELAGARLTYPFLVDLVTAVLVRAGVPVARALLAQNLLLGLALVALVHHLTRTWTSDRLAALIAPWLVLLSGGLGFVLLAMDRHPGLGGLWELLARLPNDYTMRTGAGLRWGNALTTLLVTQRSLLMGLPLFALAAALWWEAVGAGAERPARAPQLAAGVAVGLLPLVHGHCFAAALAVGAALALLFPRRAWARFFVTAALLALPQLAFMSSGSAMQPSRFLGLHLGWDRGALDPVRFWLWNTGVFLPLLAAALLWRRGGRIVGAELARFYLPFAGCFVLPNLLRLSPWIWDNVKFLFLWWVASAPLVAAVLARLLRGGWALRVAGAALLALATLAGALDVWRVAQPSRTYLLFPASAQAAAEAMAAATPPRALILHAPTYDAPVLLTGRRSLLGYPGHIWSQGLDAGDRPLQIVSIYRGGEEGLSQARALGVDFVLVGPHERRELGVDDPFAGRLPLVLELPSYRLYRLSR